MNASGNKLVYSNFTADGYQLKEMSLLARKSRSQSFRSGGKGHDCSALIKSYHLINYKIMLKSLEKYRVNKDCLFNIDNLIEDHFHNAIKKLVIEINKKRGTIKMTYSYIFYAVTFTLFYIVVIKHCYKVVYDINANI